MLIKSKNPIVATYLLKEIENNPIARDEIEDYIDNHDNSGISDSGRARLDINFASLIETSHSISSDAVLLYLKLSAKEFSRKPFDSLFDSKEDFIFKMKQDYKFFNSFTNDIVVSERLSLIKFANDNLHLMPYNTQKYLKRKFDMINAQPAIKQINNEFDAKIWAKSLPEDFDFKYLKYSLTHFLQNRKDTSHSHKFTLITRIYKVVFNKYGTIAQTFLDYIADKAFRAFEKHFEFDGKSDTNKEDWPVLRETILSCEGIRSYFVNSNFNVDTHVCFAFEQICKSDIELKNILKQERGIIAYSLQNSEFQFVDCPKDVQVILFEEARRQFLKNNPDYCAD